jgi:hypothetical protein
MNVFKALFSDFEVLDICGGFLEKIANSLIDCNMWKVGTRPKRISFFSCPAASLVSNIENCYALKDLRFNKNENFECRRPSIVRL